MIDPRIRRLREICCRVSGQQERSESSMLLTQLEKEMAYLRKLLLPSNK